MVYFGTYSEIAMAGGLRCYEKFSAYEPDYPNKTSVTLSRDSTRVSLYVAGLDGGYGPGSGEGDCKRHTAQKSGPFYVCNLSNGWRILLDLGNKKVPCEIYDSSGRLREELTHCEPIK